MSQVLHEHCGQQQHSSVDEVVTTTSVAVSLIDAPPFAILVGGWSMRYP